MTLLGEHVAHLAVKVAQPFLGVAALGERRAGAQALGQRAEDRVVIARLAVGFGDLVHRHHQGIGRHGAEVVALQCHRARQHDVGVTCGRGPGGLVHDQAVDPRERAAQAVKILVMVERIAAAPVDQADVGIGEALAVVVERLAG